MSLKHLGEPACASYDDLLALFELAPVFGEWTNLSRYFGGATSGDYIGVQSADEFFADYLDERVTNEHRPEPVGGFPRHLRLRRRLDAAYTLAALHRTLAAPTPEDEEVLRQLAAAEDGVEARGANPGPGADDLAPLQGTTTSVSAGDAGANNFAAFRRFVVGMTRTCPLHSGLMATFIAASLFCCPPNVGARALMMNDITKTPITDAMIW